MFMGRDKNALEIFVTSLSQERPLEQAINRGYALMKMHGLTDWSLKLDHARRRAGSCDYNKKQITLSRHYVRFAEVAHIEDTILHEIAHALVGPKHGHDAVWRMKAREIGCTATRCHTLEFASPPWVMHCPKGCFESPRHRRTPNLVCAKCKTPVKYKRANDDA